jgi:autotransporter-associated beta strand protein
VKSGATLELMGGIVFNAESLTLNGGGTTFPTGALRNHTGNNTWTGLVTLGSDSTVTADAGTQLTLSALPGAATQQVANKGYLLTVNSIGDVVMADNISGAGGLQKTGAGTLTFAGTSPNTYAGATTVLAGTLNLAKWPGIVAVAGAGLTICSGAFLTGSGTIYTSVNNSGTINPGGTGAAGTLTILGSYTQTPGGVLNVELGGTASGAFDQLVITGQASLAGTLNVSLLTGYQPNLGDAFAVLTFNSSVGGFAAVNGLSLGNGESLAVVSDPADLTLATNPA